MKIQLTAKETRKLTTAVNLIDSTMSRYPVAATILKTVKFVDHKFTVNEDQSSEFEIHEKSFSTFLDSGSESFVKIGVAIKEAVTKVSAAITEFDHDMNDAEKAIAKRGQGYTKPTPDTLTPAQRAILQNALRSNTFNPFDTDPEEAFGNGVILHSDSELVPYAVRLNAAARFVSEGKIKFYQALKQFGLKKQDLKSALS